MGNTLTVADMQASKLLHPESLKDSTKTHLNHTNYSSNEIPPECPMHNKIAPPKVNWFEFITQLID